MVARKEKIVNRNLLLVRYSFERLAKSFKRGELQRRWGGKVTIGKTRSKTEVQGKRVRGVTRVVRADQGACLHGRCEGDSKPAHAKPAYAAAKISPRACRPPVVEGKFKNRTLCKMRKECGTLYDVIGSVKRHEELASCAARFSLHLKESFLFPSLRPRLAA